jgi:hypothetical protein
MTQPKYVLIPDLIEEMRKRAQAVLSIVEFELPEFYGCKEVQDLLEIIDNRQLTDYGWYPIEDMPPPKDGTTILLFFPHYSGDGVRAARYVEDDGLGQPYWDMIDSYEPNVDGPDGPTKWRYFPQPPKGDNDGTLPEPSGDDQGAVAG